MGLPDDALAVLAPLLLNPRHAALLLDVDGTLAPIVRDPADAKVLPKIREVLPGLAETFGLVGFISGRSLVDLERIVGLSGCAYAGNHGMEIHPRGGAPTVAAEVVPFLDTLARFAAAQELALPADAGIDLEDKGATLTFHYRTAPDVARARAILDATVAPAARAAGLVAVGGRMTLEIRPPVMLDKGTAARALLDGTGCRTALAAGDDRTDGHTWDALRAMVAEGRLTHAVTVAVENPEAPAEVLSQADLRVDGPPGVAALLRFLSDHVAA